MIPGRARAKIARAWNARLTASEYNLFPRLGRNSTGCSVAGRARRRRRRKLAAIHGVEEQQPSALSGGEIFLRSIANVGFNRCHTATILLQQILLRKTLSA